VEFIVDAQLTHYFLEMNTRLQVEHTVTEMVTGFDLVEWQLRVAAGQALPVRQQDIALKGHAIQARLYVEDPYTGFTPQTGTVLRWRPQLALQAGVRIDDGIVEGSVVSHHYDPMVAKIIVHGRDRDDAVRRLRAALHNAPLLGLRNNGRFLSDLLDHAAFRSATMTTTLIDTWVTQGEALLQRPVVTAAHWCIAAAALAMAQGPGWRADSVAAYSLPLRCEDTEQPLRVQVDRSGTVQVTLGANHHLVRIISWVDGQLRLELDGITRNAIAVHSAAALHLAIDGHSFVFYECSPFPGGHAAQDATRARAPVAGKVTQIQVAAGDQIEEGQPLVCVEAMKMEMWLTAQATGTVRALHVVVGEQVESGDLLVELELTAAKAT
jgi:geranyl-CoA carboxylase alpha subunit